MENSEVDKVCSAVDEGTQLHRNRSFKSKQLVRSQAIRESQSPPRTASPATSLSPEPLKSATAALDISRDRAVDAATENISDTSSHASDDRCSDVVTCNDRGADGDERKKQAVEIQITSGAWEAEPFAEQRQRTKRWLGNRHHSDSSRDLLSNNPRVTCVCGSCIACPHCRGRRRKQVCPTKQDSGIVCSDECPDCSDSERTGSPKEEGPKKSGSVDVDDNIYYCRCPDRKEKPKSISLSRTDSDEKTEPTGVELVNFIKETLNKNTRDRTTLLKIEKELHALVNDTGRCIVRFPVMTSYGRMLVHRCAALFQLSHHLDQTNKNSVLVSKSGTSGGRIPCTSFKQWCTAAFPRSPQHRRDDTLAKSILKRSATAGEEAGGAGTGAARSKSLEQREREYERVRRRIFSSDNCTQDEPQWPWIASGPIKLLTSEAGRNKLIKVQSLESRGYDGVRTRGAVSKSHSFGGYGGAEPQNHRVLSKQGDLASSSWRLSPSSSGYKTLSLRSTDSVTPSPTGGASPEPGSEGGALVWAVTDLSSVPPGALVIHPQTGRPLTNPDGSLYHFDPANPPIMHDASVYVHSEQFKMDHNVDMRRGKLEKQNSFMDNECECQPSEDCRGKCCCECRRQDSALNKNVSEKASVQTENKPNVNPVSPSKTRFDVNHETNPPNKSNEAVANRSQHEVTHHQKQAEPTANTRVFESTANHRPVNEAPANPRAHESNQRTYDNNRHFEAQSNQRPVCENPPYNASPHHRPPSLEHQNSFDAATHRSNDVTANHRLNSKGVHQDNQEMVQYAAPPSYVHGYRNDEVTSPPQAVPNQAYLQPDMTNLHNVMLQAKFTPVPVADPNIRPMSLTNVVYPAQVPQAYPFVNQCRMEAPMPQVFQQMVPQHSEEPKQLAPSPHTNDTTFRIDPSYPYAADFSAACGACTGNCDPTALQHQHRSYNVSYGQVEVPQYPVTNVMVPQQLQHYPYQEPVQWSAVQPVVPQKLLVQEVYPLVYPNVYPQYNVLYPPVIPQPYPLCQPVYPVLDKQVEAPRRNSIINNHRQFKRNSISGSARNTPDEKLQFEDKSSREVTSQVPNREVPSRNISRQNSNEIAVKIQQIKDQMAQLNTKERDNDKGFRKDEWKRRNSGSGILGNYPVNSFNGRVMTHFRRTPNDDTQLSSAARAIVNSIRNMQAKNNYQHDNRRNFEYNPQYQRNENRPDYHFRNRQRQDREQENKTADKPADSPHQSKVQTEGAEVKNEGDRRFEGFNRNRNVNPVPFQYRPPYLIRQMSPGAWCRRSPGPVHPVYNHPRRPHPDARNTRR